MDAVSRAVTARDRASTLSQARIALREAACFESDDPRNPETLQLLVPTLQNVFMSSPQDVIGLYESSLATFEADGRGSSWISLWTRLLVANLYAQRGDHARAARQFGEVRSRANPEGPDFPIWVEGAIGFATAELFAGRHEQALSAASDVDERASRRFGPENVPVFRARSIKARALRPLRRTDEAIVAYNGAKKSGARLPPQMASELAQLRVDFGTFLMELCRLDDAKVELEAGIEAMIASVGPSHPDVAMALGRLAKTEALRGDWLAAQPVAQRAVRASEDSVQAVSAISPRAFELLIEFQMLLTEVYLALDRDGDAKAMLARATVIARGHPSPARDADLRSREAEVEAALGADDRAKALADQALSFASAAAVPPLLAADVRVRIAEVDVGRGDFARAETLVAQAMPAIENSIAPEERLVRAEYALARAQEGLGKSEVALATLARARERWAKCGGAASPRLAALGATESALLAKLGREDELAKSRARVEDAERSRRAAAGNQSPERARFEDAEMNVSFVDPGVAWVTLTKADIVGSEGFQGFRRANPTMLILLHGTGVDAPADVSDAEIRAYGFDYAKAEAAAGARVRVIRTTPRAIAGVDGAQSSEEWTFAARKELRVRWIGARGGSLYSMLLVSEEASLEALLLEANQAFAGFAPLDPSRVAARTPVQRTFRSERFGYALDVTEFDMVVIDSARTAKRSEVHAEYHRGDDVVVDLFVVPVVLGSAARDPEIVDFALLELVQPQVLDWSEPRVVDAFGARGREREGHFVVAGQTAHIRALTFQRDGVGWAIGATSLGLPAPLVDARLRAARAVKLTAVVPPDPSSWTASERFRHSLYFNALGLAYNAANQPARAIEYFKRSLELDPGEVIVMENLANVQVGAGQYREAARVLDEALAAEPDRVTLLALRGTALRRTGDATAAERDLRRAVENGQAAPIVFEGWLGTLFDLGRGEEALAAVDQRFAKSGAVEDRVMRAFVLMRLGRHSSAVEELGGIVREHPDAAAMKQIMLGAALMSGDPQALLAATDRLLESAGPAPHLLALRGEALRRLGRYDEALSVLDESLELAPDDAGIRALREVIEAERAAKVGRKT